MQNIFKSFNKVLISFLCLLIVGILIYATLHAVGVFNTRQGSDSGIAMQKNNLPTKKKAIILLHGLWATGACFQKTKQQLQARLPEDIEIIVLTESENTSLSITQQAARLKDTLLAKGINKESYELILLGHSQGGLRGYQFYQEFGEQFDIKGLITMGTPWEGIPTAAITKERVNAYLNNLAADYFLGTVEYFRPSSRELISEFVENFFDAFRTHEPGVQDLVPKSKFLQQVAASLGKNKLPILAIAGSSDDFAKIVLTDQDYVAYVKDLKDLPLSVFKYILNLLYSGIVTGQPGERHDMAVSVSSQLADNIPKSGHFITYTVLNIVHATPPTVSIPDQVSDTPIAADTGGVFDHVLLSDDQVVYTNADALERTVEFIRRYFCKL